MNDAARLLRHGNRLLLLLLVGLKLTGDLSWSWWVILAPAWIPLGVFLLGGIAMVPVILHRRGLRRACAAAPGPGHPPVSHLMTVRQTFAARPAVEIDMR
jgi:hypothetical protein